MAGIAQQSDYSVAAKSLPAVRPCIHPDMEKIVALEPDLCIATKDGNPSDIITRPESPGIPVYVINLLDFNGIIRSLLELGELLGASLRGQKAVQGMGARVEECVSACRLPVDQNPFREVPSVIPAPGGTVRPESPATKSSLKKD